MAARRRAALLVALALVSVFAASCSTDTYMGRWLRWRQSDVDDYTRFPSRPVENAPPVHRLLPAPDRPALTRITYTAGGRQVTRDLPALLEESGTTAFIVLRDDTLLFEGYYNGYTRDSINTSFSIAKSVTALLVGIAIDEGHIASLDDPITLYLPELLPRDARFARITIAHLLNMRSGLRYADHDLPWGDKPKAYYDPHLRQRVLRQEIAGEPGEEFVYNSYHPILLGMILERTTGVSPERYLQERLWQPLGMEYDASWSLDSEEGGMVKMESGINARAIDFSRLGLLLLDGGRVSGQQLVPADWVARSSAVNAAYRVPQIGANIHYQYGWWVHAPTAEERHAVAAWGHLGQYLYVFPSERVVIARFGTRTGDVPWASVCQAVVAALPSS